MTITRISKDNYQITCCTYRFTVIKREFSEYWFVKNEQLRIQRLCDSLSEAIDYIDFIMCI